MDFFTSLIKIIVDIKHPLTFWALSVVVFSFIIYIAMTNFKLPSEILQVSKDKLGKQQFFKLLKLALVLLFVLAFITLILTFTAPLILNKIQASSSEAPDAKEKQNSLLPTKIIRVNSEMINYIVLSSTALFPGDTLTIKINTHSSRIKAFGIFEELQTKTVRVEGKYNPTEGGIYIAYPIPKELPYGTYKARIFVQEISGMKEDFRVINYSIVEKVRSSSQNKDWISKDALGFVFIEGNNFKMGSVKKYSNKDEHPVHQVSIGSYWIMDHEITFGELKKLNIQLPDVKILDIEDSYKSETLLVANEVDLESLPVSVTWNDGRMIASKLSEILNRTVRMPTEAEWEYAARGGLFEKDYPWGNTEDLVNGRSVKDIVSEIIGGEHRCGISAMPIHAVKAFYPPNGYGLYDVAGNLWEWTSSEYRSYPYVSDDGRESEKSNEYRVIRGGGSAPETCDIRVAFRGYGELDSKYGVRYVINN